MSTPDESRQELARRQRGLIDALRGEGAAEGFNPEKIDRAGRALAGKRMRTVQKSWPALAALLGETFEQWFERYASATPNHADDAAGFVRFVWEHADDPSQRLELCRLRTSVGFPLRFVINRAGVAMFIRLGRVRGRIWRRR